MVGGGIFVACILTTFLWISRLAKSFQDRMILVTALTLLFMLFVGSLTVELWPFWESVVILYAWLKALKREEVRTIPAGANVC
jgi:ABC-type multidrug transport system permease subunit